MTVEAATIHGLRTGSSVYQIRGKHRIVWDVRQSFSLLGEALFLDHPSGAVFIPLNGNVGKGQSGIDDFAHKALKATRGYSSYIPQPERRSGDLFAEISDIDSWWSTTRAVLDWDTKANAYRQSLGTESWVTNILPIIRFKDIDDPQSVEWTSAEELGIRRIILETTGDDVTRNIGTLLPWLGLPWHGKPADRWWRSAASSRDGKVNLQRMDFSFFG